MPEVRDWVSSRIEHGLPVVIQENLVERAPPPVFGQFLKPPVTLLPAAFRDLFQNMIAPHLVVLELYHLIKTCRLLYQWIHPVLVSLSQYMFGQGGTPMALICLEKKPPTLYTLRGMEKAFAERLDLPPFRFVSDIQIIQAAIDKHGTFEQAIFTGKNKAHFNLEYKWLRIEICEKLHQKLNQWFRDAGFYMKEDNLFFGMLKWIAPPLANIALALTKAIDNVKSSAVHEMLPIDMSGLDQYWNLIPAFRKQRIHHGLSFLLRQPREDDIRLLAPIIMYAVQYDESLELMDFVKLMGLLYMSETLKQLREQVYRPCAGLKCVWHADHLVDLVFEEPRTNTPEYRSLHREPCMRFALK